jgi:NTE family protein
MLEYKDLDLYSKGKKQYNTTYLHHWAEFGYTDMNWLNFKFQTGLRYEYYDYNSFLYSGETKAYLVEPEISLLISHRHILKLLIGHISRIRRISEGPI